MRITFAVAAALIVVAHAIAAGSRRRALRKSELVECSVGGESTRAS
jgi:hypothetical protein